jgi:predicted ATP-binding protein involved in virulence
MAITQEEIEKYIFDPNNPKQCKSYKLLLNIAKKENATFFSPEFLQYFFGEQIIKNPAIENELWDKPDNYQQLSIYDKFLILSKNISQKEFHDICSSMIINVDRFIHHAFLKKVVALKILEQKIYKQEDLPLGGVFASKPYELKKRKHLYFYQEDVKNNLINVINETIFTQDDTFYTQYQKDDESYNTHFVVFSRKNFSLLNFNIVRKSIFITLEENIGKFRQNNENQNIEPLFLKKIEDVDLLLNILENDLKQEASQHLPKETISTIEFLSIKNFFSIESILIDNLQAKKEIYIVGENGDGKTLLLQAIAIALKDCEADGQGAFRAKKGEFDLAITTEDKMLYNGQGAPYKNLFAYGSNRNNSCKSNEEKSGYLTLFSHELELIDPIKWLQYLDYNERSGKKNILSTSDAKKLLREILNRDIEITITPDGVEFLEKGALVTFEHLSSGYKSVIIIICDLLSRLSHNQAYVKELKEFRGIVLIDEVELHLHPKWQYDFMKKLRDIFPLIQFIVTTHSNMVILGASEEAVFYKIYKEEGKTKLSNPIESIKNLMANNLSTSPLFDMPTARARNSDENIDTSDDFLYTKIHQAIAKRVEGKSAMVEEEIVSMIEQELDTFLHEND